MAEADKTTDGAPESTETVDAAESLYGKEDQSERTERQSPAKR